MSVFCLAGASRICCSQNMLPCCSFIQLRTVAHLLANLCACKVHGPSVLVQQVSFDHILCANPSTMPPSCVPCKTRPPPPPPLASLSLTQMFLHDFLIDVLSMLRLLQKMALTTPTVGVRMLGCMTTWVAKMGILHRNRLRLMSHAIQAANKMRLFVRALSKR